MVNRSMLRALIFDFDGLMVDTETVLVDAWAQVHAEDEVVCDRGILHALVGAVDVEFDIWQQYPAERGRDELEARYRARARKMTWAQPALPGVRELLTEARAAGVRLGVASNSRHAHVEGHLEHRGMLAWFDAITCRDDVSVGKPEPEVYELALRRLGVSADEAIAFEDSRPGHVAAHRAGLAVMVVPNPSTAHDVFEHARWRRDTMAALTLDDLRKLHATRGEA